MRMFSKFSSASTAGSSVSVPPRSLSLTRATVSATEPAARASFGASFAPLPAMRAAAGFD